MKLWWSLSFPKRNVRGQLDRLLETTKHKFAFDRMSVVKPWGSGGGIHLKFFLAFPKIDLRPFKWTFRIILSFLTKPVSWKETVGYLLQLPTHPRPDAHLLSPETYRPSGFKGWFHRCLWHLHTKGLSPSCPMWGLNAQKVATFSREGSDHLQPSRYLPTYLPPQRSMPRRI